MCHYVLVQEAVHALLDSGIYAQLMKDDLIKFIGYIHM